MKHPPAQHARPSGRPTIRIATILVFAVASGPPAATAPPLGPARSDEAARVSFEPAWEVDLSGAPESIDGISLRASEGDAENDRRGAILVGYRGAVEVRRAVNGEIHWRRDDIDGFGLAQPVATAGPLERLGWSGECDGSPCLRILDAETGADLVRTTLPARVIGPPFLHAAPGRPDAWLVPLEHGRLALVNTLGAYEREWTFADPITPPLLAILDRAAVWAGSPPALRIVGQEETASLPHGVRPRTAVAHDAWIAGYTEEGVRAWRCRATRRGRIKCRAAWRQRVGAAIDAPLHMVDDAILAPSWDTFVYAFRRKNGHLVWRHHENQRVGWGLAEWNGRMVVIPDGSSRATLTSLESGRVDGRVRGAHDEGFVPHPAVIGDLLVIAVRPHPIPDSARLRAFTLREVEPSG